MMKDQCLRPEFTYQLLESLRQGESINLISPHGQGRRRTLQDLCRVLPESWRVLKVNMRDVERRKLSLLNALLEQVNIESVSNIHDFISKINKTSIYHLIIIHNFDLLTDLNVIDYLNEIKRYPHLLLLCVSEKKRSALLATDCILPILTSKQLLAEIKRRGLALEQDDMLLLVSFLLQQTSSYSLLDMKSSAWFSDGMWK